MRPLFGKVHTTIRLTVVSVFVLATLLTVALAGALQYYFGQAIAREAATDLYATAAASIALEVRNVGHVNANVIDLLAENPVLRRTQWSENVLQIFTGVLEKNPLYYGVYLGRADGSFYEVINLEASDRARRMLRAAPTDRWVVMEVRGQEGGRTRHFRYLDGDLKLRFTRSEPTSFEVASRPWYTSAMASNEAQFSSPYLFAQLGVTGRTVSRRLQDTDTVVAIDITMASASRFLRDQAVARHGEIYLFNADGDILASSLALEEPGEPLPRLEFEPTAAERALIEQLGELKVSNELNWPPIDYADTGEPRGYSVDLLKMISASTGLRLRFVNGHDWRELVGLFERGDLDILQSVVLTPENAGWGLPGRAYLKLPFALATTPGAPPIDDLSRLRGGSLAIPQGWSVLDTVRRHFPDIRLVPTQSTLQAMQRVLAGQVDAALDNEIVLRYTAAKHFLPPLQFHADIRFGDAAVPDELHLVVHRDQEALRALLDRAIAAIGKDAHLALRERWLSPPRPGPVGSGVVPSREFVNMAADPTRHALLTETRIDGEPFLAYAAPVGTPEEPVFMGILARPDAVFGPVLDRVKLSSGITTAFLLCLLPLSWFFANPIVRPVRQLARENDKVQRREYDDVVRVTSHVKELDELSESMVNMVGAIREHEMAQRRLMDSIIELIAEAIDDKSSYTGGHCERVPELALMLAERASESDLPAFADFHLDTDEQWREFRIAAWLHDCGKITTPEHIVDKGTKLETIYNRIHEIRTRFEVLWRDAEIDYWRQLTQSPERGEELVLELGKRHARLRDDFTFLAACNVGGESLDERSLERLRKIAETPWQRHFDDRLGLSPVEELRLRGEAPELPVTEHLLADKPEHLIPRAKTTDYPPEYGIDMDIPAWEANLGELYNLSISRGTLTEEDRFRINEHMISTIKMLENLPFPEELGNVPRYASTHHETMKGTGYPRRLPGEALSVPERLLAIADVFEALTASDRPYKKAKPVSEAIDILHRMVEDRHLDRDCFELFLRERIYLRYAEKFLPPEQIDAMDMGAYLASN